MLTDLCDFLMSDATCPNSHDNGTYYSELNRETNFEYFRQNTLKENVKTLVVKAASFD